MKTRQYYRSWAPGVCLGLVLRLLVCLLALLCWNRSGWCAGFVVTNPNNAAEGSLRQAILEANQLPGPDNILFNIPGGGPHVLLITAPLPDIVDPVFINGYSQPGSKTNSLAAGNNAIVNIVLDGANVDGAGDGLRVAVSNCVVAGLHLRNHGGSAVVISNANNCALFGNFIGTPPSQGSGSHGISLEGAAFCSIGGLGRGDRNLISGNQEGGIRVWNSPTNRIAGNEIQNNSGPGIVLAGPASQGNLIDTNIISGNQVGILSRANAGGRNRFLGNRIFNNAGLGIDLNEDGVTPNDPDDSDSGPNGLQNAPELVLITAQDPLALVDGFLQSAPLTAYRLDFFSSPAPDLSLYGEGQTFIGAINIVTDSSGQFSFFIGLPVSPGDWVTATATSASGDTSEFSEAEIVGTAPTFAVQPRSQTVFAGDTVALSVRVGGISPFTFQWFRGETPLAGETNSFLVLPNIQPPDECYYVAVANVYGQTNSELACLTVQPRPLISQIPTSVFAPQGEAGMFCVTVESTGPVQYQWRLNGVNVQGATNACYDIPEVAVANQGVYYAVIIADEIPLISPRAFLTIPEIPRPAVRDDFADRLALMGMQGTIGGSSSNATREIGEPNHGGKSGSKSVWYSWEAPASGIATFGTEGSAFDTLLGIYTGSEVHALTSVGGDEDRGGFLNSRTRFNVQAGTQYQIAVDGFAGVSGAFVLSWDLVVSGEQLPEIQAHPVSGAVRLGSNFVFSVTASGPSLEYQWFFAGQPLAGATQTTLAISNVQPSHIGPYFVRVMSTGGFLDSEIALLEIDSSGPYLSADKPEDLFGQVTGGGGPVGSFLPVAAGSVGAHVMSNTDSTGSTGELPHCGAIGGASQWFGLMAAEDGLMIIDTEGSNFDTVLAVYSGPPVYTELLLLFLVPVGCDDNGAADGIRSLACFPATAGTHYYVVVDGVNGERGNINLRWQLHDVPPITATAERELVRAGSNLILGSPAATAGTTYQWQHDGANVPGATNSSLAMCDVELKDAGDYLLVSLAGSVPVLGPTLQLAVTELGFWLDAGDSTFHVGGSASHPVQLEANPDLGGAWTPVLSGIAALAPYHYSSALMPGVSTNSYVRVRLAPP